METVTTTPEATAPEATTAATKPRVSYNRNYVQENGVQSLSSSALTEGGFEMVSEVVDTTNRVVPFHAEITKKPYRVFHVNFPWRLASDPAVMQKMAELKFFDHLSVVDPKEQEKPEEKRKAPVAPEDEPAVVLMWVPGHKVGVATNLMRQWGISEEDIHWQHTADYSKTYYLVNTNGEADERQLYRIPYDPRTSEIDVVENLEAAIDELNGDSESETESTATGEIEMNVASESEGEVSEAESEVSGSTTSSSSSRRKRGGFSKRRGNVEFAGANIPPAGKTTFFRPSFMGLMVGYRGKNTHELFAKMPQADVAQPVSNVEVGNDNVSFWKKMLEAQEPKELRQILNRSIAKHVNVLELFNSSEEAMKKGPFDLVGIHCPGIYYVTKPRRDDKPATDLTGVLFRSVAKRYTSEVLEMLKTAVMRVLSSRVKEEERAKSKARLFSLLTGWNETDATLQLYLDLLEDWREVYQPIFRIDAQEIETTDRLGFYSALKCAIFDVAERSKFVLNRLKPEISNIVKKLKKGKNAEARQAKPAGFVNPHPISQFMAQFLSKYLKNEALGEADEPLFPYNEITRVVTRYVDENGLKYRDEADNNKCKIRIDGMLSYLFNLPEGSSIYHGELCGLYAEHYPKQPTEQAREFFKISGEAEPIYLREAMQDVIEYVRENDLFIGNGESIRLDGTLRILFQELERTEVTAAEFRQMYSRLVVQKEKPKKQPRKERAKQILTSRRIVRITPEDVAAAAEKTKKRSRKNKATEEAAAASSTTTATEAETAAVSEGEKKAAAKKATKRRKIEPAVASVTA